nr:hypothetical protein [Pseudidiomarina tainanensis]
MREHRDTGTGGHINMVVLDIERVQEIVHNRFGTNFGFARVVEVT